MTSPDLFTGLGFRIQGHLKIYEYDNREQYKARSPARMLLNRRNAIHKDNASILAAKTITNLSPGHLTYMVFGNGGTTVDSTGTVVFNPPRDTGANRDVYNQVFFSLVDETSGALAGNQMGVRHIANTLFSDSEIRCLIGQNEPFGQLPLNTLPTITEPTTILNINTTKFAFDEIGLKLADGTLITHVIFVPVVKTASSLIEVVYTLRVAINDSDFVPPPLPKVVHLVGVGATSHVGTPTFPVNPQVHLVGVSAASHAGTVGFPAGFQAQAIQMKGNDFWNFPAMSSASTGTMSCWAYLPPEFGFLPFVIDDFMNIVGGGSYLMASPSENALYMGNGGTLNFDYGIVNVTNAVNAVINIDADISGIPDIGSEVVIPNLSQSGGWDPGGAHVKIVNVISRTATTITTDWDTHTFTTWNPVGNNAHLAIGFVTNITQTNPAVITTSIPHNITAGSYIDGVNVIGPWFGFAGAPPPVQVTSVTSNTLTVAADATSFPPFQAIPDGIGSRILVFNAIEYFFNSSSTSQNALLSALVPFFTARTCATLPNSQWVNILVSWDMGQPAGQKKLLIYFGDTPITPAMVNDYSPSFQIPYGDGIPVTDARTGWKVGGQGNTDANTILGYISEFWFSPGTFIDFSDAANRHKFHDAITGKPVLLGADGSTPTGTAPKVYLSINNNTSVTPDVTGITFVDPKGFGLAQAPAVLGGIPNSSTMVLSFWLDRNSYGEDLIDGPGISVFFDKSQLPAICTVQLFDVSFNEFGFHFNYDAGTGANICIAVDLNHPISSKVVKAYVNNVLASITVDRDDANNMTVLWTDGSSEMDVPSDVSGYIGDIWFGPGQFFDPFQKFMDNNGHAIDLGVDGSGANGTAPAVYLRVTNNDPTSFATNHGTGGAFTGQSNNFVLTNGTRFSDNLSGNGLMRVANTQTLLAPTSPSD